MSYADRIRRKLTDGLAPVRLDLVDQSHRHAGHAGAREAGAHPEGLAGETHFDLVVVSAAFAGLSRVARQRRVHELVADELAERVHALSIRALTPEEDARLG